MATDDDIQLSDMLESYPPATTPGIQTIITAKKEFSELASDVRERLPPGLGKYFKHQIFTRRILRAYDDLVMISETGSGKSCEFLNFSEAVFKEVEKARIDPSKADEKMAHLKKVIVLVKGPTQRREFRIQLACRCSDGRFVTGLVKRAKHETVQKTNLTLEIKKAGYSVYTYTSFAHRIAKEYPTEADNALLAEHYSDTIFWIDEAHNLLIDPTATGVYREKQQTYFTLWRVLHLARRSKRVISTATPMINDENEVGSLMNLILPLDGVLPHGYDYRAATPNDIRVLFPGLPFDPKQATPEQIAPYFRGQFPPNYNFKTATLQDLEPYFRGRIGFIRASDTGALSVEQGIPQNDEYELGGVRYQSQLVIYATLMSQRQNDGYLMAKRAIRGRDDLFGAERQAANFVFPDGFWGNGITDEERAARQELRRAKAATKAAIAGAAEGIVPPVLVQPIPVGGILPIGIGAEPFLEEDEETEEVIATPQAFERRAFRRYVNVKGDVYTATPEFAPWLQDLEYIRQLSCKYAEIVRLVSEPESGNAFVYGEFVEGSGAIVLALCLEGMGFIPYRESSSMFLGVGGEALKPICSGGEKDIETRRVRPDILPSVESIEDENNPGFFIRTKVRPFRYGLLTRDTSEAKFHSMMEAMNSYENRYGDYIKVLISSRVGRDGINVNNVLQIHLIGSEWNQSAIYQALSRGLRATSHEDLIKEEEERITAEGGDPSTARVNVRIYKHAAVALDEAASSIDLQMYRMSEYKDRGIKRIMRIMKQCAIGCQVHYNRNVRPGDVDGSPTCDYDVCQYACVDPPPEYEDYSTYDVLYAGEIVSEAVSDIINMYRQHNALTLEDIEAFLPQYRRKYLIMALERAITNKIPFIDRFGYTAYLREDHGAFYLDRTYPTGIPPSYAMAYYTQGIIAIEQETLANIVFKLEAGENQEVLADLQVMDPKDPRFEEQLTAISIEGQASILEAAIIMSLRGEKSEFTDAIINKYQRVIFPINEPVTELNKVYEQANQRKPRRGRKPNPETKRRIKKINPITIDETKIVKDENAEVVYLHTLYSQVINQTGYATTARFNKGEGRTRLLKPSEIENGWRDLNEIELPIYNVFIQIEISKRNAPFEEQGIYGFVLADGKFRIRDKLTEAAGAADDARKIKRGKVCETWFRPELLSIMHTIGIPPPGGMFPDFQEKDRPQLIQTLLQKRIPHSYEEIAAWDLERLVWWFRWLSANKIKRETLCALIKAHMEATGRLIP